MNDDARRAARAWWAQAHEDERAEAMLDFSRISDAPPRGRLGGGPAREFAAFIAARIFAWRGVAELRAFAHADARERRLEEIERQRGILPAATGGKP